MARGKIVKFSVREGRKAIIQVSGAKGYHAARPIKRITVTGLEPGVVYEFVKGAIAYAMARHGTLDANEWESGEDGVKEGSR